MMPPRRLSCRKKHLRTVVHIAFSRRNAPEDQVEGGLLLDVVVAQSTAILKLLAGEDQSLLVWGNSIYARIRFQSACSPAHLNPAAVDAPLLVLDLGLNIIDSVGRLHLKGDSLAREGLDEDLHLRGR
jgi:hypothetical protein